MTVLLRDAQIKRLVQTAMSAGATDAAVISPGKIVVEDRLAEMCLEPRCEGYGLSRSCPPHVEGPDRFREMQTVYPHAVVIKIDLPMDVLLGGREEVLGLMHEIAAGVETAAVKMGMTRSRAFAGGSCKLIFCSGYANCRVMEENGKCRNPRKARPSMSGFGINVSKLMEAAGWDAKGGPDIRDGKEMGTMTYVTGLVMVG